MLKIENKMIDIAKNLRNAIIQIKNEGGKPSKAFHNNIALVGLNHIDGVKLYIDVSLTKYQCYVLPTEDKE